MRKFFSGRNQARIVLSGFVGTSVMTLYSYIVSWNKHENFKEPKLLGSLSYPMTPWFKRKKADHTGWAMHYLVGLLFAECYAPFWSEQRVHTNIKTGLILGGLSGIAAILIWKFAFEAHPFPPAVNFRQFAGQLFIAHLVFGLFAAAAYNLSNHNEAMNRSLKQ